jgi:hypothetical protein
MSSQIKSAEIGKDYNRKGFLPLLFVSGALLEAASGNPYFIVS